MLGDQLREDSTLLGDPIKIVDNVLHHDCAYPGVIQNSVQENQITSFLQLLFKCIIVGVIYKIRNERR